MHKLRTKQFVLTDVFSINPALFLPTNTILTHRGSFSIIAHTVHSPFGPSCALSGWALCACVIAEAVFVGVHLTGCKQEKPHHVMGKRAYTRHSSLNMAPYTGAYLRVLM